MDTPMTPPPVPRSAWIAGALVLALILGWVAWSHQPQLSPGPDGGFDTARAGALLEALLKEGVPHPAGSEAGRVVAGRVEETLRGLGFQVQRQELQSPPLRNSPPVTLVNIVGRLKGREPGPALLLAAHHDSVPAGPGAGDDGAGTAVVLEVARILAARGTRRDVIVLISDGEEVGLLGAAAFAMQHPWFKDAGAVLNLDNRGAAGPCHVFEIGAGEASLVPLLEGIPRPSTSSLASFVYRQMHNNSDFTIWRNAGLAGFNLAFIGDGHRYHTAEDTPANLHRGTLEHMGRTALLLATALDAGEPRSAVAVPELQATFRKAWEGDPAARSAVYQGALAPVDPAPVAFISVLNRWVVHWPASWSRWFAGAACLLVLASAFRAWRKGWFGCLGWWGWLLWTLVAVAGAAIQGMCVAWVMPVPPGPAPALAAGWIYLSAAWSLAWLVGIALWCLPGRAPAAWAALTGAWTLLSGGALAASIAAPPTSPVLLLPVAATSIVMALAVLLPRRVGASAAAITGVAGVAALGAALLPLEPSVFDALGFQIPWLPSARAALLLMAMLPLVPVGRRGLPASPPAPASAAAVPLPPQLQPLPLFSSTEPAAPTAAGP